MGESDDLWVLLERAELSTGGLRDLSDESGGEEGDGWVLGGGEGDEGSG